MALLLTNRSSTISVNLHGDLVEGDTLVLGALVLVHVSADAFPLRLRHRLVLHVRVQESVQATDLVDEGAVVHRQLLLLLLLRSKSVEDCRPFLIQIDYQVFKLLFVNLEVFHDKVVRETVPLVEVLPIVIHVV